MGVSGCLGDSPARPQAERLVSVRASFDLGSFQQGRITIMSELQLEVDGVVRESWQIGDITEAEAVVDVAANVPHDFTARVLSSRSVPLYEASERRLVPVGGLDLELVLQPVAPTMAVTPEGLSFPPNVTAPPSGRFFVSNLGVDSVRWSVTVSTSPGGCTPVGPAVASAEPPARSRRRPFRWRVPRLRLSWLALGSGHPASTGRTISRAVAGVAQQQPCLLVFPRSGVTGPAGSDSVFVARPATRPFTYVLTFASKEGDLVVPVVAN